MHFKKKTILTFVSLCVFLMGLSGLTGVASADEDLDLERGLLYSTAAVNDFCEEAQALLANTDAEAINVVHDDFDSFVQSKALPWAEVGPFPGNDGPLTIQQYVTYGSYSTGNRGYPEIISCKTKGADALVALGVDVDAGPQGTCQDVNEATVEAVFASLTNYERRNLAFDEDEVVIEPDDVDYTGAYWLTPWPYDVAYTEDDDLLHIRAKSLPVTHDFPYQMPGQYMGVYYCHLIAPEYVRALVTGELLP